MTGSWNVRGLIQRRASNCSFRISFRMISGLEDVRFRSRMYAGISGMAFRTAERLFAWYSSRWISIPSEMMTPTTGSRAVQGVVAVSSRFGFVKEPMPGLPMM